MKKTLALIAFLTLAASQVQAAPVQFNGVYNLACDSASMNIHFSLGVGEVTQTPESTLLNVD